MKNTGRFLELFMTGNFQKPIKPKQGEFCWFSCTHYIEALHKSLYGSYDAMAVIQHSNPLHYIYRRPKAIRISLLFMTWWKYFDLVLSKIMIIMKLNTIMSNNNPRQVLEMKTKKINRKLTKASYWTGPSRRQQGRKLDDSILTCPKKYIPLGPFKKHTGPTKSVENAHTLPIYCSYI